MGIAITQMLLAIKTGAQRDAFLDTYSTNFGSKGTGTNHSYLWKESIGQTGRNTDGNRRKWTFSAWVKRHTVGDAYQCLFSHGSGSNGEGFIAFSAGDTLYFGNDGHSNFVDTDRYFRDNGWYHIMWAVDTAQGNNNDRWKIYVNGELVPASEYGAPGISQNGDGYIGKHSEPMHPCIGERIRHHFASANDSMPFRGQMAQVYFIEGQQLQPSDFAETVDGVYKPILYDKTWNSVNDGTYWSDYLSVSGHYSADPQASDGTGFFGSGGNQPQMAFDGLLRDYTNSARPISSANDIIFDVPEHLQNKITKLEIYIYGDNVTTNGGGFWLDSGSGLNAHSNTYSNVGGAMTWVEYTSLPSTIKRFSFGQRTNGRSTALSAIRINGEILEDGLNIPYVDGNSYYLPLDGTTPAGEQGGFKRKYFTSSAPISKASGGKPILNTVAGGKVASTGVRDDYGDRTPAIIKDSGCVFMPGTGGAGGYNDNDYLGISQHADHGPGTGDFCVEYWVYKRRNTDSGHFCVKTTSGSAGFWIGQFDISGTQKFVLRKWGVGDVIQVDQPTKGRWVHIVIARQSGTSRIFFDGVLKGSASDSHDYGNGGSGDLYIGTDDGYYDHPGGFSNVRYIKGSVPTDYQTSSTTAETRIFTSPTTKLTLTSQGATSADVKILCCQSKTDRLAAEKTTNNIYAVGNVGAACSEISGNTILALPLQGKARDMSQFSCWPTGTGGLKSTSENGGLTRTDNESNFYGGCYYFDGGNDYIDMGSNKYFNIRTSAFTVEMWIKQIHVTDYAAFFGMYNPQFQFRINNQGRIQFLQDHGGTRGMTSDGDNSGTNLRDEEWHHVAVVRQSNFHWALYVDGVAEYKGTGMNGDIDFGSGGPSRCYIGMRADSQAHLYKGYISDVRVIKAAKYHKDFVPASTHPKTLGNITYITGSEKSSNNSYPSNDVTSGAVMFERDVQGTLECTSTGIPKGSDSRTIEFWAYIHNKWHGWQNIFSYGAAGSGQCFGLNTGNTDGTLAFTGYSAGDWDTGIPAEKYADAWHHFVVTYYGTNTVEIFIDGISIGSATRSLNTSGTTFHIGGSEHGGEHFTGMISNFRVRTGRKYTSNFIPPTEPLTADSDTVLLCCQSSTDPTAAAVKPGNLSNPGTGAVVTRNNPFDDDAVTGKSGGYAILNNLDRHSNNGKTLDGLQYWCNNTTGGNIRANIAVTSGKWYFESTNNNSNRAHVGWMKQFYIVPAGDAGMTAYEWMYRTDEFKIHNGEAGEQIGNNMGSTHDQYHGAVAMIAYDADAQKLWFGTNGKWHGKNSTATPDPVAGTGAHFTGVWDENGMVPMVGRRTGDSAQTVNFGQFPFKYTPPAGFLPLSYQNVQSNLDITEPKKHFGVLTWTGNGSSSGQVITGLEFQPDLVWIKGRNHNQNHLIHDSVRGEQYYIKSDENSQQSFNEDFVTQLRSDGIKVGNSGVTNDSGENNLAWCWKAGGIPTTTNSASVGSVPTAGSVKIDGSNATAALAGTRYPNKMSVNTKAGFSIVHYTGTGNNFTLAHGLNRRPDIVVVKTLDGADVDWMIYTKLFDGSNDWLAFNTTSGKGDSGFNGANATVFDYNGGSQYSNTSGRNYIQYNWTSVPGYSKIGKYASNGSNSDGFAYAPYVHLGFRPALVIIKSLELSDSNTGWGMYTPSLASNTSSEYYNHYDKPLWANHSLGEGRRGDGNSTDTSHVRVDFLSEGFKIRSNSSETNGGGNDQYLYMAWAETPAVFSVAR